MESKKKKNIKFQKIKEQSFDIKGEPMAQLNAVIKKLKKKQKIKNEDISDMYNEKCASLCEKIENNKLEIENYKTIIFTTQQSLHAKDKEVEELTSMMLTYKKKAEEVDKLKETIKQMEKQKEEKKEKIETVITNEIKDEKKEIKNEIKDDNEHKYKIKELQDEIYGLKNEINRLNNETKNYTKKLEENEAFYKNIISENEKQIDKLTKKIEELNKNNDELNKKLEESNKKIEELNKIKNEESEKNKNTEKKDEPIKLKDEVKNIKILKEKPMEYKMLIFNNIVAENLFLCYLLCRCYSYGKIIKELANNFRKYANTFIKDRLKINSIFSNVLYEFFYRSYNRTDLSQFAIEIYDNNSVTQNEDFEAKILEMNLYTDGCVNDAIIQILNSKINNYKYDTYNNIKTLAEKCKDFIQSTSILDNIRKFEPYLYNLNKSKLKIDLTYLTPDSIGHLVTAIKYTKNKIKTVEFTGELIYDRHNECLYTYEVFYQLVASHGIYIKEINFNNIKKFSIYKLISLTYTTNYFIKGINILLKGCPNLKNFYVNNCEISDDNITDFEFPENQEYSIINFANNKIYKLKNFKNIKTIQLILNHNKIRIYQGDNDISMTYLDISAGDFSIKDFNKYMGQSSIKILNISDTKIAKEEEGNNLSNTLKNIKGLQIIYLNNCQLNIKSLPPLLANINTMDILELYLSGNPLGNECMKSIADFIDNCKSLQKIDLSGTKITNEGLENIIDAVKYHDKLKEIVLENNSSIDKDKVTEMFKSKEQFNIIV